MPRLPIPDLQVSTIIELYCYLSLHEERVSGERVLQRAQQLLGDRAPSLRKIQDIVRDHRRHVEFVTSQPEIRPLGSGWPRESDDVAYLGALGGLHNQHHSAIRWTARKIATALELKTLLGWPWDQNQRRHQWSLPDPRGYSVEHWGTSTLSYIAGELAIIDEISSRRVIADQLGEEARLDDVYHWLLQTPWNHEGKDKSKQSRDRLSDPPLMQVMTQGFVKLTTLDLFEKTLATISAMSEWQGQNQLLEHDFYQANALRHDADRAEIMELELKNWEEITVSYGELQSIFLETLGLLEELIPASTASPHESVFKQPSHPRWVHHMHQFSNYAADCKEYLWDAWERLVGQDPEEEYVPEDPRPNEWSFAEEVS